MKKWQENRNYKRIKDENGKVIANIITVDGQDVEVSEAVFNAYSSMDRRERYIGEEAPRDKVLSLEQMVEDGVQPEYVGVKSSPSAEELCLEREDKQSSMLLKQQLLAALVLLDDVDRQLITALFFDGASTRECARRMGVTQRAVIKRRDRILRDMKKYFEKFSV